MQKTWLIIDVYNLLYRSFYGLKPLYTSKKVPIQAVFGFFKSFLKSINKYNPDYIVACIDTSTKSLHRTEFYPEYKANRFEPPVELETQKEIIKHMLNNFSINIFQEIGFEADDGIAHYANFIEKYNEKGIILTSDKDLHYLISDNILIHDPMKELLLNKEWIKNHYGQEMTKEKFLLYFSLVGDTADNIPGVKGIGPKTVNGFLSKYSSLDDLYNNLEEDSEIKPRIKQLLLDNKKDAYISYNLCKAYVPNKQLKKNEIISWKKKIIENLYPFFEEYEFTSLLPTDYKKKISDYIEVNKTFTTMLVISENDFTELKKKITEHQFIAFDCETQGEYKKNHSLIGFSLSFDEHSAYYIPLKNLNQHFNKNEILNVLNLLFLDETKTLIMHHAFFDLSIIIDIIPNIKSQIWDTLLAASLCIKDINQKKGLKDLSLFLFNERMNNYDEIVDKKLYNDLTEIDLQSVANYGAADARQTWKLYIYFKKKLEELDLTKLYIMENQLIYILLSMYKKGIYINKEILHECKHLIENKLYEIQEEIEAYLQMIPGTLNLRSPKQVRDIITNNFKIRIPDKTKISKEASTDQETLEKIKDKHPLIKKIIDYRIHSSIESRCIDGFLETINPKTNSLHPSYNYYSVVTGRITTYDPNLQNIPQEYLGLPYSIREAFEAHDDNLFISLDYSQIELRILAHLANDKKLIDAFNNNEDIHLKTAQILYQKNDISDSERQSAKILNFSIIYGASHKNISEQIKCSLEEAKEYINKHKNMYPSIYSWMNDIINTGKKNGFVSTMHGRRRYIPQLNENNILKYNEGKRFAVNTIIQGSAAEILKKALIEVHLFLKKNHPESSIVLQIHDELIIETSKKNASIIAPLIATMMEKILILQIPLKINYKIGKNFKEIS